MAVFMSHPPSIRPPSPALTNPDMILPYNTREDEYDHEKYIPRTMAAELTPPQSSLSPRPSLPGAWLSEDDVRPSDSLQPGVPNTTLKSPVARFLHTLDPKMRHGIGIEVPEYSPSIYSPTVSDGRTPEGQDETSTTKFPAFREERSSKMGSDEEEDEDFMGARAEEILANAKQRLLAMENNLTRARTLSLGTVTSEAPPTIDERPFPMQLRNSFKNNPNHIRISSDTKVTNNKPSYESNARSVSALGSSAPFGSFVHKHHHLEPLNEDDLLSNSSADYERPKTSMSDLQEQMNNLKGKINSLKQKSREDSMRRRSLQALKSPSPFTNAEVGATSPFQEHMRPGSNSSDRSEEFLGKHDTAVKEFDAGAANPEPSPLVKFRQEDGDSNAGGTFFDDGSQDEDEPLGRQGDRRSVVFPQAKDGSIPTPASAKAIFDHVEEDKIESAESRDVVPMSSTRTTDLLNQGSTSIASPAHEDRPDAFDYENYILNSTMGSYSRTGFRSRSGSVDSVGTASTERPLHDADETIPVIKSTDGLPTRAPHIRTMSSESASSTATFATAITGTGRNDSRTGSRAGRTNVSSAYEVTPKASYSSLRSATNLTLPRSRSPLKRNSFSPLPSPSGSAFPFPSSEGISRISPEATREQMLALLLRCSISSKTGEHHEAYPDAGKCWAPEDEQLVGKVIDGLVKVVGRIVRGEDEGEAGRSVLESIGAVLEK